MGNVGSLRLTFRVSKSDEGVVDRCNETRFAIALSSVQTPIPKTDRPLAFLGVGERAWHESEYDGQGRVVLLAHTVCRGRNGQKNSVACDHAV